MKDQWSPALTLKTALVSIQALLSAPEPDDPQDAVVAQQVFFYLILLFLDVSMCTCTEARSPEFYIPNYACTCNMLEILKLGILIMMLNFITCSYCFFSILQYLREYQTFVGTARYWTESFAKASSLGVEEKVCAVFVINICAVYSLQSR